MQIAAAPFEHLKLGRWNILLEVCIAPMVAKDLRQALLDGTATLLMPKRGCSSVQRFYKALRGRC